MEPYVKIVTEKEFLFTLIANEQNISPKLIYWEQKDGKFTIHIEKYPATLNSIVNRYIYEDEITRLIKKLHSLGIFHRDIHIDNIVINPESRQVKLIDFGLSCWMQDIPKITYVQGYRESASCLQDLLKLEIDEVKWLCGTKSAPDTTNTIICLKHKMIVHPNIPTVLYCEYGCGYVQKLCF